MERQDANARRSVTPGNDGWERSARPGDPRKYLMISADCHANEPVDLWATRIDAKYRERIPKIELSKDRHLVQLTEGFRPIRLRSVVFEGEDRERNKAGKTPEGNSPHKRPGDVRVPYRTLPAEDR